MNLKSVEELYFYITYRFILAVHPQTDLQVSTFTSLLDCLILQAIRRKKKKRKIKCVSSP